MNEILYDKDIIVEHDSDENNPRAIGVSVFSHHPTLIDVCSQDGGSSLSVQEAKQLIQHLQEAIEIAEAQSNVAS